MSDERSEGAGATPVRKVANLGIVRPPLVYVSSIGLGLWLHFTWPVRLVPTGASVGTVVLMALGGVLMPGALVLFVVAVRALRAAGTPVPGNRPTTAIVRTGPYRFSRNPIYLAFSLFQLGVVFWVDSAWLAATLAAAVALMALVVVPREERYLEARFPSDYPPYKASVRRWL